jgi:hypothetical protein
MSDYLVVQLTPTKIYRITCSECHQETEGSAQDLPVDFCNPSVFKCRCGHSFKVLLDFRAVYRKPCMLQARYTMVMAGRPVEGFCTVLELSRAGIRLETTTLPLIQEGQSVQILMMLDDSSHTKLSVSGVIQWHKFRKNQVLLGVHFGHLDPHQQQILGMYLQ